MIDENHIELRTLSEYNYQELFELLHNIDPFKYPARIESVRHELELRKERNEVPVRLIPEIDWEPLKFWK